MTFEEKLTWVFGAVTVAVSATYFTIVLGQLGDVPVSEIGYQRPLLIAIGAAVVMTIVGAILTAIGTAVGQAISVEVTGKGSMDDVGKDIDRKDERDASIGRRGDLVAYYVTSVGMVGVLALTMLEYEYFWIANALYLSFVVGSLAASGTKIIAYRRGF